MKLKLNSFSSVICVISYLLALAFLIMAFEAHIYQIYYYLKYNEWIELTAVALFVPHHAFVDDAGLAKLHPKMIMDWGWLYTSNGWIGFRQLIVTMLSSTPYFLIPLVISFGFALFARRIDN